MKTSFPSRFSRSKKHVAMQEWCNALLRLDHSHPLGVSVLLGQSNETVGSKILARASAIVRRGPQRLVRVGWSMRRKKWARREGQQLLAPVHLVRPARNQDRSKAGSVSISIFNVKSLNLYLYFCKDHFTGTLHACHISAWGENTGR